MRRSKKNVKRVKQDPLAVAAAENLVLNQNWTIRKAALEMKIRKVPYLVTLVYIDSQVMNLSLTFRKNDACRVFSDEEEHILSDYLKKACIMHYGLLRLQFRCLALKFAQANKIKYPAQWDRDGMAGKQWYYEYMLRHPSLSLRKPQAISLSCSTSFNITNVSVYFEKFKGIQEREMFTPDRIFNIDETGVTTVHNPPGQVISPKGAKRVGSMTSGERGTNFTMIAAVNAIGNSIPPAFVFPHVHFKDNMIKGAPPGSFGTAHISGWSSSEIFVKFLHHLFDHVKPSVDRKVLIVLDNHRSHVSIECSQLCKDSGIVLLTFPPHTSHKLQPLDRTAFGPFKNYYNSACTEWMLTNCGRALTIYDVAECTGKAYPRAFTPQNICSGFHVAGIWPLNDNVFSDCEFMTTYVTDRENPSQFGTLASSCQNEPTDEHILPGPSRQSATSAAPCQNEPTDEQDLPRPSKQLGILASSCQNKPTDEHNLPGLSRPIITPQEIRPYPKAPARKGQRSGPKQGRCRILTDTPEKAQIEIEAQKIGFECKISQKSEMPKEKLLTPVLQRTILASFPSDNSLNESSDSEDDREKQSCVVHGGDFAIARVMGKKKEHFYVVEIVSKEDSLLQVKCLKRIKNQLGTNKFVYCCDTVFDMTTEDIVHKLPMPIRVGPTTRQSKFVIFRQHFDGYTIE